MAQFANNFTVSGFVCNDATVYDFGKNKLAKFGLSISREDTRCERGFASAIISCEAWRKPENSWQFDKHLKKGHNITISGFFCPQEYTDQNGNKRSSFVLRVTNIENTDPKPESAGQQPAADTQSAAPAAEKPCVCEPAEEPLF